MKLNPVAMLREEPDGSGILFDPDHNRALTVNPAGVAVWNCIASGGSPADAAAELLRKFRGVTPEQAERDVAAFLTEMREKSLLFD